MNLILSLEQEKFIQSQIATGKYANKQQVIETALTLLQQQTQDYEQWLEDTRAKVKVGLNQLARGEKMDGEIAIAQLKEKFKQQ